MGSTFFTIALYLIYLVFLAAGFFAFGAASSAFSAGAAFLGAAFFAGAFVSAFVAAVFLRLFIVLDDVVAHQGHFAVKLADFVCLVADGGEQRVQFFVFD